MTNFLDKVQERALAAAKILKGFDFNISCYKTASSYNDAFTLWLGNLLRDLREVLVVHKVEGAIDAKLFLNNLHNFYTSTYRILVKYIEELVEISKIHDTPQTIEEKEELKKIKQAFASKLETQFTLLRERSSAFLKTIEALNLNDVNDEIKNALNVWSKITFESFFLMLKSGKIDWIKKA